MICNIQQMLTHSWVYSYCFLSMWYSMSHMSQIKQMLTVHVLLHNIIYMPIMFHRWHIRNIKYVLLNFPFDHLSLSSNVDTVVCPCTETASYEQYLTNVIWSCATFCWIYIPQWAHLKTSTVHVLSVKKGHSE